MAALIAPAGGPTSAVGGAPGGADERLTRVFTRFIAAGYLFDLATTFSTVVDAYRAAPALTVITAVAVFGTGAALLPASYARDHRRVIGRASTLAGAAYLGSVAAWLVADAIAPLQLPGDQFLYYIPALAAMAVAMPARPAVAVGYGVIAAVGSVVLNHRVGAARDPYLPAVLFALVFSAVFLSAAIVAWRAGRRLDLAHAEALAATAADASAQARGDEQQRFAALVHDDVIATLLAATRVDDAAAIAQHARTVLVAVDEYEGHTEHHDAPASAAASVLGAAVGRIAPHAEWSADVDPAACRVPSDALTAASAAISEALRNVHRHAGPGARATVLADFGTHGFTVTVTDDGAGFDPRAVAPDRLGVAGSIIGRMGSTPGGAATVDSVPGAGTTVTIRWTR
ncbi:sensor histidine kinase [Tsukamurella ocularis]|uniref:sensor histidine kinase n=1 Tax=Tsukamurella ocularis TaxID=1970234 RepID=UPI0039EF90FF